MMRSGRSTPDRPPYSQPPHRERTASKANAWLSAIIENSADAILIKTLDGSITTWNAGAERLFGFAAAEAVGQPVTTLIPKDRLSEEDEILRRLRAGESIDHFETVRRRKDVALIHISLTVSPVRDEAGHILGASKIARDISAQTQAFPQQRLLLHELNHRIKNLFSLTAGLVELSARTTRGGEHLLADLQARLNALARAHALTMPDLNAEVGARAPSTTV